MEPVVESTPDLRIGLADFIATVEIDRPPNNFFDVSLIEQIAGALDQLSATRECRVVVLCSTGRHFCAGANLSGQGPTGAVEGPHLYDVAIRLFEQPLPIVACVQGGAVGGGLGLALAADFRVATPEARFTANFSRLGFHQGFGLSVTMPLVVGHQRALELLYTGRRITGDEAFSMGLVDRLVSGEELRSSAFELAGEIAGSAPLAVRSIRATMRESLATDVRAAMAWERSEQERLMQTSDWSEGVKAMTERRSPKFTSA